MFYSQIVLTKKGPLAKVWLAAHHEKKLSRPQIFAFDISDSVENIVHPVVPLALRVSGHLLLGVVRIYSRKVKYLMEDAHEASLKINTAFANSTNNLNVSGSSLHHNPTIDIATNPKSRQSDHLNIANFGEFQPIAFIEGGFEIPTNLVAEDWDVADDDDEDDDDNDDYNNEGPARKRSRSMLPDDSVEQGTFASMSTSPHHPRVANLTMQSDLTSSIMQEDWPAFDPDQDDDEDYEEDGEQQSKNSSLPEIEITRAADNSLASDSQARVASALQDDSLSKAGAAAAGSPGTAATDEFPQPDLDDDQVMHPFDDDDEDNHPPPEARASLALSVSHEDSMNKTGTNLSIGGLDDSNDKSVLGDVGGLSSGSLAKDDNSLSSEEFGPPKVMSPGEEGAANPKKRPHVRPNKRRIRKIAIDAADTRLSGDEIRQHLNDPTDVEVEQIHPSTWLPGVAASEQPSIYPMHTVEGLIEHAVPIERYLARPTVADQGSLCPKLLKFWLRNTAPVQGKEFAYELQNREDTVPTPPTQHEDEDGLEITRKNQGGTEEDEPAQPKLAEEDEGSFPQPDDDIEEDQYEAPAPFDDDQVPPPPTEEMPSVDEDFNAAQLVDSPARSQISGLSLGHANDLLEDFDDEEEGHDPRQDQGDELVSSSSKWHKHTIKIYDMLHRAMPTGEPRQLLFDNICNAVTRRTACGVFFELLQLKTWDIIDVDQDEHYGDMKISPGVKFDEKPATVA